MLDTLGLPEAWATTTGEGVAIAVLDSGIQADHPDLTDHLGPGRDVIDGDDDPEDSLGTGTHSAGVAAAVTDNGIGIAGVAPGATLLGVRVLDDEASATTADVAEAIAWAAEQQAGVIALTLGGDTDLVAAALADDTVQRAIRAADDNGSVVVVPDAGTGTGTGTGDLPVLSVAPADETGSGNPTAVTAPATDILGTAPTTPSTAWPAGTDGYEVASGPGPATAAVAGVAALLVSQGRTPVEVRDLLVGTTQPGGLVDAAAAVEQADSAGAGGAVLPTEDDGEGALPPAAVGAVAVAAAALALGTTLLIARRVPVADGDPPTTGP